MKKGDKVKNASLNKTNKLVRKVEGFCGISEAELLSQLLVSWTYMEMQIKLLLLTSFWFWSHSVFSVLDKHETKLKGVIYFQAIEEVYYDHLKNAYKVNFVTAVLTTYHMEYPKYSSCCKIKGRTNIIGKKKKKRRNKY